MPNYYTITNYHSLNFSSGQVILMKHEIVVAHVLAIGRSPLSLSCSKHLFLIHTHYALTVPNVDHHSFSSPVSVCCCTTSLTWEPWYIRLTPLANVSDVLRCNTCIHSVGQCARSKTSSVSVYIIFCPRARTYTEYIPDFSWIKRKTCSYK